MAKEIKLINLNSYYLSEDSGELNFPKPSSMVGQIHKNLVEAISKGKLKPGQPLRELELQKWFGTSRAPIREAIRLLESEGLIIVDTYKKKYVRPITKQILKETVPVMACLEGLAANLAAEQISEEKISSLQKITAEMGKAFEEKNYDVCANLNFDFHRTYVKLCNNEILIKAIRSIMKNTIWLWITSLYYTKSELIPLSLDEHEEIIESLQTHNALKAEEMVRKHITNVLERSLELSVFSPDGHFNINNFEIDKR